MDDIRRHDLRLFLRELVDPWRVMSTFAALFVIYMMTARSHTIATFLLGACIVLMSLAAVAWGASERRRFFDKSMQSRWQSCNDRMARLEEVLKKLRRDQIADLKEMPQTIRGVASALYLALRRADIISHEVRSSEQGVISQPPAWNSNSTDPQSRELYRLADKNIAEYRAQYAGVMAGVQRTEAQSAVFMTTLDTLRMKIIGYRLVGRSPELASQEFLEALAEARMQLQSIDTALEELDLGHYPKTISVVSNEVPPAIPEDVQERLRG